MLLTCSILNAKKVCKSSCVKRIQSSTFTYNYYWNVADDDMCTSVPWKGMNCSYYIFMNGNLIDSGTCDGNDAVTC